MNKVGGAGRLSHAVRDSTSNHVSGRGALILHLGTTPKTAWTPKRSRLGSIRIPRAVPLLLGECELGRLWGYAVFETALSPFTYGEVASWCSTLVIDASSGRALNIGERCLEGECEGSENSGMGITV